VFAAAMGIWRLYNTAGAHLYIFLSLLQKSSCVRILGENKSASGAAHADVFVFNFWQHYIYNAKNDSPSLQFAQKQPRRGVFESASNFSQQRINEAV